jgi:uncharacterized protein (TIGR01777 family)
MKIAITGASGFIGKHLSERLTAAGHQVAPISLRNGVSSADLSGCDAVIHLSGEPVAQRWTAAARKRILDSRVNGTRLLVEAIGALDHKPSVLISASAVGIYGSRSGAEKDEILTESSASATDFLGHAATAWEREAFAAEKLAIRVACLRFGVVLGQGGGALDRLLVPFKLGIGGRLGTGEQWMSWIELDDLCSLILFVLDHSEIAGPVNATAPQPVTNAEFTRALASAIHRPAIFPVPAFALKLLFGEMSQVLLEGQRVYPEVALKAGFRFKYPEIGPALQAILAS